MKLINTTVFRLAIQFAGVFAILSVSTLLSVYYITIHEIEEQAEAELIHELTELATHYNNNDNNYESLIELIKLRNQYGQPLHHYYALTDSNNQLIAGNQLLHNKKQKPDSIKYGFSFYNITEHVGVDDHEVLILLAEKPLADNIVLVAGQAQNSLTELREHTFTALSYAVIITIILALLIGTYMGSTVLTRIRRIDLGLENAINSDFKQQLSVLSQEDEFQALTLKLNVMLSRIENLIKGMRQVTDNIAHDLRSPLTRMRSRLEVTLLKNRDEAEYRQAMQQSVDDCNALLNTFNSLLSIAQAESGVFRGDVESIDLSALADELADLYRAVAEDSGLNFIWLKPDSSFVQGSRQLLAQAINNLLENAIKYTPKGGTVTMQVISNKNTTSLTLSDSGPGIAKKDRQRVLERFQRLDAARSEMGNGLGLSMVNAVVKLHKAQLTLSDNHPGLKVTIAFPCMG